VHGTSKPRRVEDPLHVHHIRYRSLLGHDAEETSPPSAQNVIAVLMNIPVGGKQVIEPFIHFRRAAENSVANSNRKEVVFRTGEEFA